MIPEQGQLIAEQQGRVAQPQPPFLRLVPAVGGALEREQDAPPPGPSREVQDRRIVRVQDPDMAVGGVLEQQLLVGVIGIHGRVAVQMVRGEVREDADLRREVRAVVQLERRHLDREPLVSFARNGDVGERSPDVPRGRGRDPRRLEQVRHERRGCRLPVRPRDGDAARSRPLQGPEPEVDLGDDGHARRPRGADRWRIRRHAGREDHRDGRADLVQIVAADFHLNTR